MAPPVRGAVRLSSFAPVDTSRGRRGIVGRWSGNPSAHMCPPTPRTGPRTLGPRASSHGRLAVRLGQAQRCGLPCLGRSDPAWSRVLLSLELVGRMSEVAGRVCRGRFKVSGSQERCRFLICFRLRKSMGLTVVTP